MSRRCGPNGCQCDGGGGDPPDPDDCCGDSEDDQPYYWTDGDLTGLYIEQQTGGSQTWTQNGDSTYDVGTCTFTVPVERGSDSASQNFTVTYDASTSQWSVSGFTGSLDSNACSEGVSGTLTLFSNDYDVSFTIAGLDCVSCCGYIESEEKWVEFTAAPSVSALTIDWGSGDESYSFKQYNPAPDTDPLYCGTVVAIYEHDGATESDFHLTLSYSPTNEEWTLSPNPIQHTTSPARTISGSCLSSPVSGSWSYTGSVEQITSATVTGACVECGEGDVIFGSGESMGAMAAKPEESGTKKRLSPLAQDIGDALPKVFGACRRCKDVLVYVSRVSPERALEKVDRVAGSTHAIARAKGIEITKQEIKEVLVKVISEHLE